MPAAKRNSVCTPLNTRDAVLHRLRAEALAWTLALVAINGWNRRPAIRSEQKGVGEIVNLVEANHAATGSRKICDALAASWSATEFCCKLSVRAEG